MNNAKVVRARIAEAFVMSMHQSAVASEIAFHMTDWDHNIDDLLKIYNASRSSAAVWAFTVSWK